MKILSKEEYQEELKLSLQDWYHCTICQNTVETASEMIKHFESKHKKEIK